MPYDPSRVKRKPAMRVFVYEYFTATGIGREPGSPEHGIYLEGRAMRDAVAEDFRRIPGVEVIVSTGREVPPKPCWCLVIAPETDGYLAAAAEKAVRAGHAFLGPSVEAISLTSDKLRLAEHWRAHGIP